MTALLKLVPLWAWALLALAALVGIQELRISWKESARISAEADLATSEGKAASLTATIRLSRELLADRDALDTRYTQELADAQALQDQLRADIAAGRKRVSVNAVCVRTDSDTGATGSIDAGTPRLTPDAEQARADLEYAVERQRKQIIGLHEYINSLRARLK